MLHFTQIKATTASPPPPALQGVLPPELETKTSVEVTQVCGAGFPATTAIRGPAHTFSVMLLATRWWVFLGDNRAGWQ